MFLAHVWQIWAIQAVSGVFTDYICGIRFMHQVIIGKSLTSEDKHKSLS